MCGSRRRWTALSEMDPDLVAAFLAAEDRRFYRHPGVDPRAVVRAAWSNLRARAIVSGGSTISMQLARMLRPAPRTWVGKARQVAWALRLERHLDKQTILEIPTVAQRLEKVLGLMESEISVLQVEKRIRTRVKRQMEKTQREYYLNEQMKAIQKELGDEDGRDELAELEEKIEKTKLTKEAREKAMHELKKLRQMSPMSAEATVVRNYLDWLLSIPWNKKTKVKKDLVLAQKVLDDDHFGLEKVKERIVEYLAVQQRANKLTGPILCLVGPPGVGKTSLGKSIAKATGREFVRVEGIVRPSDIAPDNSVVSWKVADAYISYGGQGTVANAAKPGWLYRFFNSPRTPF